MKKITLVQQSFALYLTLSTFAFVMVMSLTVPLQPISEFVIFQDLACLESRRGTRCKMSQADKIITKKNNSGINESHLFCFRSTRGTRCQNRINHLANTQVNDFPSLINLEK